MVFRVMISSSLIFHLIFFFNIFFTFFFLPLVLHVRFSQDVLSEVKAEEIVMGMASQICEREDALLCSDVRDKLFGFVIFFRNSNF